MLHQKLLRRARLFRALFLLLGTVGIAWATQRAGIELPQALCFFLGAVPVLWVFGWLFGFLFQARRAAKDVATSVGSTRWQAELEAATIVERVKLCLSEVGLQVSLGGGDGQARVVPWSRVKIERVSPQMLAVFLRDERGLALNEGLQVPRSAFSSDQSFDDFCLAMQRRVWEGERS